MHGARCSKGRQGLMRPSWRLAMRDCAPQHRKQSVRGLHKCSSQRTSLNLRSANTKQTQVHHAPAAACAHCRTWYMVATLPSYTSSVPLLMSSPSSWMSSISLAGGRGVGASSCSTSTWSTPHCMAAARARQRCGDACTHARGRIGSQAETVERGQAQGPSVKPADYWASFPFLFLNTAAVPAPLPNTTAVRIRASALLHAAAAWTIARPRPVCWRTLTQRSVAHCVDSENRAGPCLGVVGWCGWLRWLPGLGWLVLRTSAHTHTCKYTCTHTYTFIQIHTRSHTHT